MHSELRIKCNAQRSTLNIQVGKTKPKKRNPSAVAGKGFWCFEAQVGARAKTVEVKKFTGLQTPGGTVGATRPAYERPITRESYFFLVVFFVVFLAGFLAAFFAIGVNHLLSISINLRGANFTVNGFFQLQTLFSK